jgi:hypothetical protein
LILSTGNSVGRLLLLLLLLLILLLLSIIVTILTSTGIDTGSAPLVTYYRFRDWWRTSCDASINSETGTGIATGSAPLVTYRSVQGLVVLVSILVAHLL